jgi:hypothetical protein
LLMLQAAFGSILRITNGSRMLSSQTSSRPKGASSSTLS